MAVAPADRRSQPIAVALIELVELAPAPRTGRDGELHLDAVDVMALEQAAQHARLDRPEEHRHEGVRNDHQRALFVDCRDGVFQRHPSLDWLFEEPTDDVGLGRPSGRDLLPRDHAQPDCQAALLHLFDGVHGVVVRHGDQIEVSIDRGLDELRGCDHAVRRDRVAVRIREWHQSSKRDRTNASGSKLVRSSIPSPTPASLTGTPSSDSIAITAPPLALLSSFARTSPVMGITRLNSRACTRLVSPSTASITRSDSYAPPSRALLVTRPILASSSSRLRCVCRRPAVSTSTTSLPRARAAWIPSNTTDAGSAPLLPSKRSTPARCAHTAICSIPAARYVSAATTIGLRPSCLSRCASLPIDVVFPAPLIP